MIGRIHIGKYKVDCLIGVYPHEQKQVQSLWLDLIFKLDMTKSVLSDQIEDTFDYDQIMLHCQKVASLRHYRLLEHFSYTLLASLFHTFSPIGMQITVTKKVDGAEASVTLKRGEL